MTKEEKIKKIKGWFRDGSIKKLYDGDCFAVPAEAFDMGITPRLVASTLAKLEKQDLKKRKINEKMRKKKQKEKIDFNGD